MAANAAVIKAVRIVLAMFLMSTLMLKLKKNPSLKPKRSNFFVLAKVFVLALFCSAALAEVLQIKLKPGAQDFSFSLPANPTTGYHWSVVSYDQTLMQLKSAQYHAKTGNLIGRG